MFIEAYIFLCLSGRSTSPIFQKYGIKSLFLIMSMIIQMLIVVPNTQAGTFTEVIGFGGNPGNLKMYKYVPDNMPVKAPLVVSLHGCSQTASAYSSNGWKKGTFVRNVHDDRQQMFLNHYARSARTVFQSSCNRE